MNRSSSPHADAPPCTRTEALYRHARTLIPGGTQLLSKRPELFAPGQWPAYYREARGCRIIDPDGREYTDFSTNGIGSCLLGYADPDVNAAVIRRVETGAMCSLNSPDEVELATRLTGLHPWAERARFARSGGEALSVAVRIARSATGRDAVAICGYHGWCDWYLAANLPAEGGKAGESTDRLKGHLLAGLSARGIPSGLAGTTLPFTFNDLESFRAVIERHGSRLAAVVMEPMRTINPAPGFLETIRETCDAIGACLVFDEVTTGFRLHHGGVHLTLGVNPDIAVFAKALGNGHPISAIIGRASAMDAAADTFISSTYWTEGVGYAAALATLAKMERVNLPVHLEAIGTRTREGLSTLAAQTGVPLQITGRPAQSYLSFAHPKSEALLTLYTVEMLRRGFLSGGAFYPTYAHTEEHVDAFLAAAEGALHALKAAMDSNTIEAAIGGPVRHTGFQRLN